MQILFVFLKQFSKLKIFKIKTDNVCAVTLRPTLSGNLQFEFCDYNSNQNMMNG